MPRGTPTELARLRGTSYAARAKRLAQASGSIGAAPEYLSKAARRIWRQTVESAPEQLLRQMDRPLFTVYCTTASLIEQQQIRFMGLPEVVEKGQKAERNRILGDIGTQSRLLIQLAKQLGLTPEIRSRMDLPAKTEASASVWDEPIAS